MKNYILNLNQINGGMSLTLFDGVSKKDIHVALSVAPSQWEEARRGLLITLLRRLADKLEEEK